MSAILVNEPTILVNEPIAVSPVERVG